MIPPRSRSMHVSYPNLRTFKILEVWRCCIVSLEFFVAAGAALFPWKFLVTAGAATHENNITCISVYTK
jgi:hypothetical protein